MGNEGHYLYQATTAEISVVQHLPDNIARAWAEVLSLEFSPLRAFHPVDQTADGTTHGIHGEAATHWRIAGELGIKLVDEPVPDQPNQLGPYYMDGPSIVRGIAVWQRRIDSEL